MVDLGQMYKGCYRFLPGSSSNASECQHGGYLRAVQTVENVVFSCVPSLSTAARITIEMVPAMRAYSIAVAPDSSRMNRVMATVMEHSPADLLQPARNILEVQFLRDELDRKTSITEVLTLPAGIARTGQWQGRLFPTEHAE